MCETVGYLASHSIGPRDSPAPGTSSPSKACATKGKKKCTCRVCGKTAAELGRRLQVCSKCVQVAYCGPHCQKSDWPMHKTECRGLAMRVVET